MNLTKEYLLEIFEYKNNDLYWRADKGRAKQGEVAGSIDYHGYRQVKIDQKIYLCHRLVFFIHHSYLPDCIDHIDRNPLNNSIENLRECTPSENSMNRGMRRDNTSGVKGVYWYKPTKKWKAQLFFKGKNNSLGYYESKQQAEQAVKKAREKYHGEFSNHG